MSDDAVRPAIKLSVRDLVEFSARSGDLFFESASGPSHLEGIAGHRQLQKSRGDEWQAEYPLKQTLTIAGYEITLQGRIDLLNTHNQPVIVEEIKTTYQSAEDISREKLSLYWAQAKVYAYLFSLQNPTPEERFEIHISLFNVLDDQVHTLKETFAIGQLRDFTHHLLEVYLQWYALILARRQDVLETAKKLEFPHTDYRPGQHRFARQIYRTIRDSQQLLAQAPTGTGKTISTLFPAIKAAGEGIIHQIVYLTAKTPAQLNAETALRGLRESGLRMDTLTLVARDKTCPCRQNNAGEFITPDGRCCLTVGFYDRLPDARVECLDSLDLSPAVVRKIADRYQICPFALALQMLPWASTIVCDFNYFFDPLVKLKTFESETGTRALLVDEVHNLPERAREMYSATISTQQLAELTPRAGKFHRESKKSAGKITRKMRRLKTHAFDEISAQLAAPLAEFIETLAAAEAENIGGDLFAGESENRRNHIRNLLRFYIILQRYDSSHRAFLQIDGHAVSLQARCLDASHYLQEAFLNARAVIGFSATLNPLSFYRRMVGFDEASQMVSLPPAFPPENLCVIRCDYIDTRWKNRVQTGAALARLIHGVYQARAGKYLAFFPSYDYMNQVHEEFRREFADVFTIKQAPDSGAQEREIFLDTFFNSKKPALGFAILGGIFAEGVDYVADALHGVIIVGAGMPQPTQEQKQMQEYFERQGLNGFQYAFQFPGFSRVLQTAGRVIRSEHDKGVVLLVDPRYQRADYRQLMPADWKPAGCRSIAEVEAQLEHFWHAEESR